MSVPTNLIPTKITGLPEYTGTSQLGYFPYVLDGTTYKVQFSSVASSGEVPPSRTLTAGTGLTGGGDLSANRVFAIANGGVGANQLDTTGVVAGVYGDGSNVPTVTVDANGRVTSVTTSPVVATGYVPEGRLIIAGTGLSGGGSLANNVTLSVNLASATPQALGTATAGVSTAAAREDHVHPAVDLSDTNETQGALPLGRGGTGDALSPVAGAVVYSTGTKLALTNPGIAGQVLVSTGTDEPVWSNAGAGTVTSVDASGGVTGMTFTGGPITLAGTLTLGGTLAVGSGGTGVTGTPTNGQLLIGNGTGYALSTLTAGTAVSITNAAGSITIDNTAPDQIVSLTGAGTTSISGTYPNFTITSNDQYTGTVTSVAASGGATGLTFSGSPITTSGTLTLGGTLAVASGGTGATTASGARTNLGAAASGANSDITSLSGITGGISTADYVAFDTTYGTPPSTGQLAWNNDDGTLDVGLNSNVILQVGQESLFYAKNTSGGTIPIGTPVMFTGVVGASGKLTFGLAVANNTVPPEYMMGVTAQNVPNNGFGYVTSFGLVRGFNTTGAPYGQTWAEGDLLYFDPATPGGWTNVEPAAPNIHVPVAVVVNAASGGSGSIFVRMVASPRLGELQDVEINGGGPAAGQVLIYDASQSRWENNTLTAGSNVTITNGNGTVTIAATEQFTGTVTSVAASGGTTGLTFSGSPITNSGTLTLGGTLAIGSGGTGASTAGGALTALGAAASGANTDITSVALTSGTILNSPVSGTDIVNKAYADSIASGINFHQSVRLATVAALPAYTYNNGSSGVGATITANANGALSIDGVAVAAGNRVLIKDEVGGAQAYNGVYTVTQTGSGSTPFILTRATDFDSAGSGVDQIDAGDFFLVTAGNTLANTSWVQQTPLPITVGTTAIVFSQFGAPVLYSAGTGLTLAGTVFSITNTGVSANTYGSASSVPVIAVNAQGQITSASSTSISIGASQITSGAVSVGTGGTGLTTTPTNGQLLIGNGTGYSLSTLTAGTGMSVTNGSGSVTVTNTAPDQIVSLTGAGATVVSGTYPNFTITTTTGSGTVTSVDVSGGTTGLSFTGGPITSSGTITMGGTLAVANGGTGVTTSTGSGSVVLSTSPTLVTPTLGVASATSIATGKGTVGAVAYGFTTNTNTGMWSPSSDAIAFSTAGSERFRVTSGGEVGVGTSSPTAAITMTVLANSGNAIAQNIRGRSDGIGVLLFSDNSDVENGRLDFRSNYAEIKQTRNAPLVFSTNSTERARIDSSGNVGIGTTAPAYKLDVAGTAANTIAGVRDTTGYALFRAANTDAITFFGQDSTGGATSGSASASLVWGNNNRPMLFATNNTERMRIDSSGNVGIGTSSPSSRLTITGGTTEIRDGNYLMLRPSGNGWDMRIQATGTQLDILSGGALGSPIMSLVNGGNVGIGTSNPLGRLAVRAGTNQNLLFRGPLNLADGTSIYSVNDANSAVLGLEFGASGYYFAGGNVGIGLTNPGYPLAVQANSGSGALRLVGRSADSISTLEFTNSAQSTTQGYIQSNGNNLIFATSTSERMRIDASGNVGIGTSSPGALLDVSGTIRVGAGSTDPGTGGVMYLVGSGAFQTVIGGAAFAVHTGANNARVERARITSDGSMQLSVGGVSNTHQFLYNESGGEIQLIDSTGAGPILIDNINGLARFYKVGSGSMSIGTTSTGVLAFNTNSAERMRIDSSGQVGIGTTTINARLSLGALVSNKVFALYDDGTNQYGMGIAGSQYRMFAATGANLCFGNYARSTDTFTETVRIDSSGNVGIGITSPSAKLDVVGNIFSRPGGAAGAIAELTADASSGANGISLIAGFASGGYGPIKFLTTATERMRIDSSGNVGIGVTSPPQLLAVGNATDQVGAGVSGAVSTLYFGSPSSGSGGIRRLAYDRATGNFNFIGNSVASPATHMTITAAGDVGIGTSSPSGKLDVVGGLLRVAIDGSSGANLLVPVNTSTANNTTKVANILFQGFDTVGSGKNVGVIQYGPSDVNWVGSYLAFQTRSSDALSERMRIDSSGNVGIGTSSPGYPLSVQANSATQAIRLVGRAADSISTLEFTNSAQSSTQGFIQSSGNNLLFATSTTERMRITSDGSMQLSVGGASNTHQFLYNESGAEIQLSDATGNGPILIDNSGGLARFYKVGSGAISMGTTGANYFQFITNGAERMRIDSSGNLGIGTSSPGTRLQVADVAAPSGFSSTAVRVTRSNYGADFIGYIDQGVGHGAIISTVDNGTPTERMRINSAGNVGIGTSSPGTGAILDVQSTTKGVRFPNMTSTQKTAFTPAAGTVVFDTTLAKLCVYTGAAWQTISSL